MNEILKLTMVQDDIVAKVEPSLKQTTYNKAKRPLPHLESMAFFNVCFSLVYPQYLLAGEIMYNNLRKLKTA